MPERQCEELEASEWELIGQVRGSEALDGLEVVWK